MKEGNKLEIRKAITDDIPNIIDIFKQASKFISDYGSNQWQDKSCPNQENVVNDINENSAYVLINEDKETIGYFCLSFNKDVNYDVIKNGRWESDYKYAVLHRIALSDNFRGQNLSKNIFDFAENECIQNQIRSIRIDTHILNEPMKAILKNRKYKKAGIIFLQNKEERIAYEKIIIPFIKGDIIKLKKNHPCGNDIFKILRIGMDFRLECMNCHSQIWLSRADVTRRLKKRLTVEEIKKISIN